MLVEEFSKPNADEYAASFERYVSLITEPDIQKVLHRQQQEMTNLLAELDDDRAGYRYEPEKWTIREVLGHIIDAERVFGYRALCIARGEQAPLAAFDENEYALHAGSDAVPLAELLDEFRSLRESHIAMFRHLPAVAWFRIGTANEKPTSVRALAHIMAGHVRHHMKILKDLYHL